MITNSAPPNGDPLILHLGVMAIAAARAPELRARFVELAGGTESAAHEYLRRPRALKTMQGADFGPLASALWPNQRWDSTHDIQASYAKARELLQIENELVAVAVAELHAERWRLRGSAGDPLHSQPIPATVWSSPDAMFHFDTNTVEIGSSRLRHCRMQRIEILSLDEAIASCTATIFASAEAGLAKKTIVSRSWISSASNGTAPGSATSRSCEKPALSRNGSKTARDVASSGWQLLAKAEARSQREGIPANKKPPRRCQA
jgi:hypothetical protein